MTNFAFCLSSASNACVGTGVGLDGSAFALMQLQFDENVPMFVIQYFHLSIIQKLCYLVSIGDDTFQYSTKIRSPLYSSWHRTSFPKAEGPSPLKGIFSRSVP